MKIKISDLDLSLQTRAGTDAETINTYAENMDEGANFPEVTVFTDGEHKWLADGFHRVMAAKQLGKTYIDADIRKGTEDDAVVFGGTANNKQGKRPTRADIQHFLEMVWERREAIFGGTPTGGNFAYKCGVSTQTGNRFVTEKLNAMPVAPSRPPMPKAQVPTPPKMPTRPTKLVGADGKMYPVRPMPTRPASAPAKPAHVVDVDRFETEIPLEINDAFKNAGLINEIALNVSKARVALRRYIDEGNITFGAVRQDAIIQLDNAYRFITAGKPFCVCRMCQGNGCRACHERGWQTEEEYERNPREFKHGNA